jgi:hypothetical protein
MVVNFLHVNDINYSIIVCFSKTATIITISRKLVKMGGKFCLFMWYAELNGIELWMAEESAILSGGLEIWTVEGRIRRGI